jgi:hypothetical protein
MEFEKPHAGARLASGIEAGVVGGLAMLGVLLSESLWDGHVWWDFPNLLGSTFYGPRAFRSGAGMATLSGLALHFVITGTLGGLFGLVFGGIRQRSHLVLLGLLAAVGWYNLANVTFWPNVNPWVLVASPRPATMVSHVLFGACLGYMGQRQRLSAVSLPEIAAPPEIASAALIPPAEAVMSNGPLGLTEPAMAAAEPTMSAAEQTMAAERRRPPAAASSDAVE